MQTDRQAAGRRVGRRPGVWALTVIKSGRDIRECRHRETGKQRKVYRGIERDMLRDRNIEIDT